MLMGFVAKHFVDCVKSTDYQEHMNIKEPSEPRWNAESTQSTASGLLEIYQITNPE